MNILVINLDKSIFSQNSTSLQRLREYSGLADKIFVIVWTQKKEQPIRVGNKLFIYATNSIFKIFYYLDTYKIAKKITKDNKIDLIFTQDPYETGLMGWLIASIWKLPLQLQMHTDLFSPFFYQESIANKLRVMAARFLIKRADLIKVVSRRIKSSLQEKLGVKGQKIFVLPIFVNTKSIVERQPSFDLHVRYPQFEHIILMASRLTKEKNIPLAIEAMSEVLDKFPKTGLIIVGSGPEERSLRRMICQSKDNIIFEDWTTDINSYYKTADIFLLTSNYEGYGMAAIEAMASGCPIVMTDVGCAGDVVKDGANGLIFPVGDKIKLSAALIRILEDKNLRKNLKSQALAAARNMPNKDESLKKYFESWQLTINNHNHEITDNNAKSR